jgi:hypothetical protein
MKIVGCSVSLFVCSRLNTAASRSTHADIKENKAHSPTQKGQPQGPMWQQLSKLAFITERNKRIYQRQAQYAQENGIQALVTCLGCRIE